MSRACYSYVSSKVVYNRLTDSTKVCVTAECGDYVEAECGYGAGYLKSMKLLPRQTEELELKIMGHHREHL